MNVVRISGKLEAFDRILEELCTIGVFMPENAQSFYSSGMGLMPFDDDSSAQTKLTELENLAKTAGITLQVKSLSQIQTDDSDGGEFFDELAQRLRSYADEKSSLEEQLELCKSAIDNYSHFKELDVDIGEINECKYVKARFGHLPISSYEKISKYSKNHQYISFFPCSFEKNDCWGVYFAPLENIAEVDGVFASLLFEQIIRSDVTGTIEDILDGLRANVSVVENNLRELEEKVLQTCRDESEHLSLYYSKLSYDCAKQEVASNAYHNQEYFFIAGWVPKKQAAALKKRLKETDKEADVQISEPDSTVKVSPPVKTRSFSKILRRLVEPYTFYVDLYGTPSYDDIDVTAFVAITYTLLFGIMFGDLGQGFVLSIVGALMWKKKRMGLGRILVPCGISSMIFGFIFGSVFGYEHLLDPVYKSIGLSGKPLEVFENVNLVLLIAIGIGVFLVACAIIMNIYGCIKRKCLGEALLSQNGLAGLMLYLCGANLASAFMGGFSPLPSPLCISVIAVCAVILIVKEPFIEAIDKHEFKKPESLLDFFLQNFFEFIEYVLSYMSNTVSFLRVGAFVLVHAGMMMVVFSLASDGANIIVVILGNALVIALEGLLTGIQALRLEYYEMFSRFYIGDGRKFKPAKINNK